MSGYKTYIVSALTVIWALFGMVTGHLDTASGTQLIATSALASALRHGIATTGLNSVAAMLAPALGLGMMAFALTACTGGQVDPAKVSVDQQKALWFLQAAGCITSSAAAAAQPIVASSADAQGNLVLSYVAAGAAMACKISVPAAAVVAAAPAPAAS